jgi:alkanesulfonate monooxygenase SsuD/methylene tetrahydromethanopterin reductase-like flavin-dependent oxidoreductase (luciferase family)
MLLPEKFKSLNQRVNDMLLEAGRDPMSVRRSMMTGCVFGKDDAALKKKLRMYGKTPEELRGRGIVAGSLSAIKEQLLALEQAGLQRIMVQWLDLDDLESMKVLAKVLL